MALNCRSSEDLVIIRACFERGDPLHGDRMATCPECEYDEVDTEDMEEGDTLSCPECGKHLVVTGVDEVDLAPTEDDDDDDDLEDEEEEDDDDDEDEDDLDDDDIDEEEELDE